jgi:PBP1b-binding outer membrane lipoprotein LpoB
MFKKLSSLVLLAILLAAACSSPAGEQEIVTREDAPIVTVFRSPT